MPLTHKLTAVSAFVAAAQAFVDPIAISSPQKVPTGASWNVPHDFASFSFPAHWFADFAGNLTHPNLFSRDILDLLYSKTGSHPFIRVGGTSTDRVWYNATQKTGLVNYYEPKGTSTTEYGIPDRVDIGPAFFDGFLNFPGTHWSWQINMGQSLNNAGGIDNAMEVAKIVLDYVQDRLESFELGNEPELMVRFLHRPENYSMESYVHEWNEYADVASEQVLKGNKYGLEETRFFQGFTFTGGNNKEWNFQNAVNNGIDSKGHLKSVSYHQYAAGNQGWVRLQNSYMNHTANKNNVTQYDEAVDFAKSHDPVLPFVLGETNSNSYNLNMAQVEGVLGSALWLIDHLLLGMAANMTRYNLIQGTTFGYSGWVPVARDGREPHVRSPLYGQIFAADVLGHHPEVQVYPIPDLPWNVSAYGIYEATDLARYVVVNYDEWNSTTAYERPVQKVNLAVPTWVENVQVRRLTGNGASADEGITWAGQSWNHTAGRLVKEGAETWEVVSAVNGSVDLGIQSTEAMLVSLSRGSCS